VRFNVMHTQYVTLRNGVKLLLYWAVILDGDEIRGKIFVLFAPLVCEMGETSTRRQTVLSVLIP
jgi:hypothetical protein